MTEEFTPLEGRVLSRIQWNFPLDADPYGIVAAELASTREDVLATVRRMRAKGVIRRVGGSFAPKRLGYVSVLVAGRVEPDKLEAAAGVAASFSEVTHNYERQDRYNLWFTVIAENPARLEAILDTVRSVDGVHELHSLPALKTFKIRVNFAVGHGGSNADSPSPRIAGSGSTTESEESRDAVRPPYRIDDLDRRIIPRCCGDIGDSEYPFKILADEFEVEEHLLLERLAVYKEAGVLRRFGAILRHQRAGFVANGMSIWNVPAEDVDRVGSIMSGFPEISHCYERPRFPGCPYNLFGMIHGESKKECLDVAARVAEVSGIDEYRMLFSVREFKKTSMVYERI